MTENKMESNIGLTTSNGIVTILNPSEKIGFGVSTGTGYTSIQVWHPTFNLRWRVTGTSQSFNVITEQKVLEQEWRDNSGKSDWRPVLSVTL
jgi:hypothetical protein